MVLGVTRSRVRGVDGRGIVDGRVLERREGRLSVGLLGEAHNSRMMLLQLLLQGLGRRICVVEDRGVMVSRDRMKSHRVVDFVVRRKGTRGWTFGSRNLEQLVLRYSQLHCCNMNLGRLISI